jgi:GNAT superfamily N-acetyltransferase
MLHNGVMKVRPLHECERSWLSRLVMQEWGIPVVSVSGVHDPSNLPGFVAVEGDRRVGVVTYRITDEECEVVTLNSLEENKGVGTALLCAVKAIADQNAAQLWLITTDDNGKAIRFYENRGMTRAVLHRNFIDVVRVHKPHVNRGAGATRYCDAIEFRF